MDEDVYDFITKGSFRGELPAAASAAEDASRAAARQAQASTQWEPAPTRVMQPGSRAADTSGHPLSDDTPTVRGWRKGFRRDPLGS